jgi:hypothetical protein
MPKSDLRIDDFIIAIEGTEAMAERFGEPTAVLDDGRVVLLRLNNEPPLEIIRPRNPRPTTY